MSGLNLSTTILILFVLLSETTFSSTPVVASINITSYDNDYVFSLGASFVKDLIHGIIFKVSDTCIIPDRLTNVFYQVYFRIIE